ncbi:MAG: hypothetical protein Fur0022_05180 [Anaerolineales bacterium]
MSLISMICCVGSLELVGYVWEQRTAQDSLGWTLVASRRLKLEQHGPSERSYYLMTPNESYIWENIPVQIGSSGFRTDEFEIPKPAGTTRILNLGDSIAFGWEVRYEETYGKLLETMLADGNGKYEVINAGVPAWNPASERNFLLDQGLAYDPDLVIFDFTTVNDFFGRGPVVSEGGSLFDWLRDHTYFWPFLTTEARFLLSRQVGPEAIPVLNPPSEAKAYFPLDPESPKYEEINNLLIEMQQACAAQGIPFVLVIFPTALQVNSSAHPTIPQQVLTELGQEMGFSVVDLTDAYKKTCEELGENACEGYENELFADVWMHPNALGHQITAEQILPVVQELLQP